MMQPIRIDIEIEGSSFVREGMYNEVCRDNGLGGTSDANNREYGGYVENGAFIPVPPGAVSNPMDKEGTGIDLPIGKTTAHSHPSGTRTDGHYDYSLINPLPLSTKILRVLILIMFLVEEMEKYIFIIKMETKLLCQIKCLLDPVKKL